MKKVQDSNLTNSFLICKCFISKKKVISRGISGKVKCSSMSELVPFTLRIRKLPVNVSSHSRKFAGIFQQCSPASVLPTLQLSRTLMLFAAISRKYTRKGIEPSESNFRFLNTSQRQLMKKNVRD